MDLIRRAFNLKNAAILLGVAFAVSGIVSTIVHGVLADEVITGVVFLIFGLLFELLRKEPYARACTLGPCG